MTNGNDGDNRRAVKFASLFCELAAAFNRDPDEVVTEAYWKGLLDLDIGSIERAVDQSIKTMQFMPTVCELRRLAGVADYEDMAASAFDLLSDAVMRYGSGASVDFHDTRINAVVRRLGGWEAVCSKPESTFDTWTRKEFISEYVRMCVVGIDPGRGDPLIGRFERDGGVFRKVAIGHGEKRPRVEGKKSSDMDIVDELANQLGVTRRLNESDGGD